MLAERHAIVERVGHQGRAREQRQDTGRRHALAEHEVSVRTRPPSESGEGAMPASGATWTGLSRENTYFPSMQRGVLGAPEADPARRYWRKGRLPLWQRLVIRANRSSFLVEADLDHQGNRADPAAAVR